VLKARPKDVQAMYELAEVEADRGGRAEAIDWLEKAHGHTRRDTRVTSRLVELYLALGKVDSALNAAKETLGALPDNLDALAAMAEAEAAAGNIARARSSLERMEVLAGFNAVWQYRIADSYAKIGNLDRAVRCLEKALSAQPDQPAAQVRLTEVELQAGQLAKAEQRAKAIAIRYPERAIGRRLLGDVAMARKNYAQGIEGYRSVLSTEPSTAAAIRLANAYVASGDTKAGALSLEAWLQAHPTDTLAINGLAEVYLSLGNFSAALSWYGRLLKIVGEQPDVLNNIANVLVRQGDANAVSYAERAYALAPNDAAVIDTLGWVLVQQRQLERGLRYLREARLRAPSSHEIRYHLAVALARAGRRTEARSELESVVAGTVAFDGSEQARQLWEELSAR
jgi:putative PEP-CTERM system TPR-repeat lipoprotein